MKVNEQLKNEFMEEIKKIWGNSQSMMKHTESGISNLFKTSNGFFIEFDKPSIKTRFCYSYDEHVEGSHEEATKACDIKAITFLNENLKGMQRTLKDLQENKIYLIKNYNKSDIIMQFVSEQYKQNYSNMEYFNISEEDKNQLIEIQKDEIEKFTKRLNSYLKKYGTTKLKTWTYSAWD